MIELLKKTRVVLKDSGGLQKEAYFFKKPCVTLRDETEWVELVKGGFNKVAGTDRDRIIGAYREMKSRQLNFSADLYGNGLAAVNVVDILLEGIV